MAEVQELVQAGKDMGLAGEDLRDFVKQQQDLAREQRILEREKLREVERIKRACRKPCPVCNIRQMP